MSLGAIWEARDVKKTIPIIFLLLLSQTALASDDTYHAVIAGKKCHEQRSDQSLVCSYKVGRTLDIEINGIGSRNVSVVFLKSDFHGDYYGQYGLMYGSCVLVNSVKHPFSIAFISPRNGEVYKTGPECQSDM